jgi:hypothetical protein
MIWALFFLVSLAEVLPGLERLELPAAYYDFVSFYIRSLLSNKTTLSRLSLSQTKLP